MRSNAYFSPDRRYRYWLTRIWDDSKPTLCVIGVNPSTADEAIDDATIRKCIGFAKRLGFGGLLMLNVGAFRATDPRDWHKADDPFGPENTVTHLKEYIAQNTAQYYPWETPTKGVTAVVAAWGKNCSKGRALSRSLAIVHNIRGIQCWGRNSDGTPRHPLMLPYTTQLESLEVGQ